ncbi:MULTISPECIES: response regulator transcription factor [Loigolactobacillus]|uniref:DNA-binding response regulator n=1 Tax=Loigolactobacillus backii TaxID=375175 RepID=A0A192GZT7_9LACO|nr:MULTISPECIES: response regulator transcription factor [Loigolactobacillus]ANK58824.1 DNA-binding response regulator [Loigolactobacillus backii]ANK61512.1 DNA-binding response regulator [Loigolactobacillus backii]ANK63814.1 DNA-binding response regulator [Loigolactobacillus backii]ANK66262.1 DNA-binding response regulator [Loigolactobacillus backii]ANK69290.1 DNA-binding response regulator [Loigolactobacillus backii]
MRRTILLVEDEESLISFLQTELKFEDYAVIVARDGKEALTDYTSKSRQINLILLDWMLPKLDGLEVMRRIRRHDDVPIIMMTARDYVGDKVAGLDNGADDYITKPFEIEELLARIRVALRRDKKQNNASQTSYKIADLLLDTKSRQVRRAGKVIQLTQREYDLLLSLIKHKEETLTRDELLNLVWGVDFQGQLNIVDVYIRYLRNKIDFENKPLIHTVRGVGYTLRDDNVNEKKEK